MKNWNDPKLLNSKKNLVILCLSMIIADVFLLFLSRYDIKYTVAAVIVTPAVFTWAVYSYFHEKKDDKNAVDKSIEILNDSYFRTSQWHEQYITYRMEHPFEKPKGKSMKSDLYAKYRNKDDLFLIILFFLFVILLTVMMFINFEWWYPIGVIIFLCLGLSFLNDYTGKTVRKFLKRDIDYPALERSYLKGKMLTYKNSGIILGTTHIHIFTADNIYAIDYRIADDITRKVVRVKEFDDSMYTGNRYDHYAVVNARIPKSGSTAKVEVELNEYQVQMIIDEFHRIKYSDKINKRNDYEERSVNHIST